MRTVKGVLLADGIKDRVIWAPLSSNKFSCRSSNRSIVDVGLVSDRWKMLWDMPTPLKVKCFSWLLLKDGLAVRNTCVQFADNARRRATIYLCIMEGFTGSG